MSQDIRFHLTGKEELVNLWQRRAAVAGCVGTDDEGFERFCPGAWERRSRGKLMLQKKSNEKCQSRDEHEEEVTEASKEEDRHVRSAESRHDFCTHRVDLDQKVSPSTRWNDALHLLQIKFALTKSRPRGTMFLSRALMSFSPSAGDGTGEEREDTEFAILCV